MKRLNFSWRYFWFALFTWYFFDAALAEGGGQVKDFFLLCARVVMAVGLSYFFSWAFVDRELER